MKTQPHNVHVMLGGVFSYAALVHADFFPAENALVISLNHLPRSLQRVVCFINASLNNWFLNIFCVLCCKRQVITVKLIMWIKIL